MERGCHPRRVGCIRWVTEQHRTTPRVLVEEDLAADGREANYETTHHGAKFEPTDLRVIIPME